MKTCGWPGCKEKVIDINERTGKPYCYCRKHMERKKIKSNENYYKYKARYNKQGKSYRNRLRKRFLKLYGNKCACCGETEKKFLTLDHIHADRKINGHSRNNYRAYTDAVKNVDFSKYQILCWNCNCAKGKYGMCPHKLAAAIKYEDYRDG